MLQLVAPRPGPRIPPDFEHAAHVLIQRALEHYTIPLAIVYGQLPWEDELADPPVEHSSGAETLELQLALILDDDVGDFVATKLHLTRLAYDTFVETGFEIAPFPIPITHWYLPAKAPNPALIEEIRSSRLRLDIDRARATPVRRAVQRKPKSASAVVAALHVVATSLLEGFTLRALYYLPQCAAKDQPNNPVGTGLGERNTSNIEAGPVDILIDFGGRPDSERLLGVQEMLEHALELPVQLLTTSSVRREVLDALLRVAVRIEAGPGR